MRVPFGQSEEVVMESEETRKERVARGEFRFRGRVVENDWTTEDEEREFLIEFLDKKVK